VNSSDFLKIHDIALAQVIEPNTEYYYRNICRWYSEKFHTPLHVVETELQPSYVLRHYYEVGFSQMKDEELDSALFKAVNPEHEEDTEEDIQNFIKQVVEEAKSKQKKSDNKKEPQSLESKPSDNSDIETVTRVYDELPPPEAGSDPDDIVDSTPVLSEQEEGTKEPSDPDLDQYDDWDF
jgi:hypothetical protein